MTTAIRVKKAAWRLARAARVPFTSEDVRPEYEAIRPVLKRMLTHGVLADKALETITRRQFDELADRMYLT